MSALRRGAFFLLNRLAGSRCADGYREMFEWERLPHETLQRRQQARLEDVLAYAVENVPFYRDRVAGGKRAELAQFPVLERDDLREQYTALMDDGLRDEYEGRAPRARYSWVETKTGGTTGAPTSVIHDSDFRDFDRAARLYAQALCGFPFGTPYFRLWGSMREINSMRASRQHRAMALLAGERILNAFQMEPHHMRAYLETINRSRIGHMMAYVDAAHELVRFARQNDIAIRPLRSVMSCAGTLTDDVRSSLETAVQGAVHDKYGSRDAGDMACECSEGGMHVFANRCLIEIVDRSGAVVVPGNLGRILVTVLGNRRFPLIRYAIGDMGTTAPGPCSCGRTFPLLENIEGRVAEFLTSTKGGYVSPSFVCHLVGVEHNPGCVDRFQMVQQGPRQFELRLQVAPDVPDSAIDALTPPLLRDLRVGLGEDAAIDVQRTPLIEASASGKFLYCVNRTLQAGRGTAPVTDR
jgi:phenylacetate-CoA ligase